MTTNYNEPDNQNLSGVKGRRATPEEVARRDGYVQGRKDENSLNYTLNHRQVATQERADGVANGVIIGLIVALLAGGIGAALYLLSSERNVVPVSVPGSNETRTEIKLPDVNVEAPDVKVPEVRLPDVQVPDVNVQVPEVQMPDVNVTNQVPSATDETMPAEPGTKTDSPAASSEAQEPVAEPVAEPAN